MELPLMPDIGCIMINPTRGRGVRVPAGALLRISVAVLPVLISACSAGVLDPHGPVGDAERHILFDATVIMLCVVVPVIAGTFLFAWWFRAGNLKAKRRPEWAYEGRIEFVVWTIPALVVLFLGGIAWIGSHDLDPREPLHPREPLRSSSAPLDIQVVSLDWKWLFIYPGFGVASVNHLVVPVGMPLRFRLTSAGVMNSFFIPQFGSQIYTMAGMATELNLQTDDPGTFGGLSAQFSGDGFSDMRFDVVAVPTVEFEKWVEATRAQGGSLDAKEYATLVQPSERNAPISFGAVSGGLFDAIVASPGTPPTDVHDVHPAPEGT
jgi:cytochrome o ubiquinol oxidase subunit 2